MKKKLIFLALLFSFLYGCSSFNSDVLSKDNGSDNTGGNTDVTYTITFESNGGTGEMSPMEIKNGERKNLPVNTFTKTDYNFAGWSLSVNGNPSYRDGDIITAYKDTVLYAQWIYSGTGGGETGGGETGGDGGTEPDPVEKYTIIFDNNNGAGFMNPITVEKGNSVTLTKNVYYRDGFSFAGWSRTANGTVEYKDEEVISITENITLYAVWSELRQYKITYHSNNGLNESKETFKFSPVDGGVVYLDANEFTNGSMKFVGWSEDKASKRGEYQDKAPLSVITKDMDLYAVWDAKPVSLSFDANGGSGKMPTIYAKVGDKIILPEATFTRTGYYYKGNEYYSKDNHKYYPFNSEYTVTEDNMTFSMLWLKEDVEEPIRGGNSEIYRNMDVWVDGVTVKDTDWIDSTIKGLKQGVRRSDSGWYDTDQSFFNLCWAGASSNLLHWWYDRNKENIERYFRDYASPDKKKPNMEYVGYGISRIFNYYVEQWPNHGYYIDKGLIWYLIGAGIRPNGGFFEEVLGDNNEFVEEYGALNQYRLNTALEKAFKNKMAIGASETNMSGPHAITIWGAHFDENGLVDKIYVADSATKPGSNSPNKEESGLLAMDIVYKFDNMFGSVYMKTYMGGEIPLTSVTLFSNCHDRWDNYFKTHEPRKK